MYALTRFTPEREVVRTDAHWEPLRDHIASIATTSARWGLHPIDDVCWEHYGTYYAIELVHAAEEQS